MNQSRPLSPESVPVPHPIEHFTDARFSLANVEIGSTDQMVHHPSHDQRLVTYATTKSEQLRIRDQLIGHGLILGRLISGSDEGEGRTQAFAIPDAARLVAYDSTSYARGDLSYGDIQLFAELGTLLAEATNATDGLILIGDIRHAVALVEFTRPGERKLLLVPGVENLFASAVGEVESIDFYTEQLRQQIGEEFLNVAEYFRRSYAVVGHGQ